MRRFILAIAILQIANLHAQPLGQTFVAGTTWYDVQSTGSVGRTIAVDREGWANVVWLNTDNDSQNPRRNGWNLWNPENDSFLWNDGQQIWDEPRASFVQVGVLAQNEVAVAGHVLPQLPISGICVDFAAHVGAFACTYPPLEGWAIYPRISVCADTVHMLTLGIDSDHPDFSAIFYNRGPSVRDDSGHPVEVSFDPRLTLDSNVSRACAVTSENTGNRVAAAWLKPVSTRDTRGSLFNNVFLATSQNGGRNWSNPQNITDFYLADTTCCDSIHNNAACRRDTLVGYVDVAIAYDRFARLHCAFTTRSIFFEDCDSSASSWINQSLLYHWSEATNQFSLIADGYWPWPELIMDDGAWQLNVQRPCLAEDTTTGFLYCAYMQYDTNCYSIDHFPSADIYVSVSTDGGSRWSSGTNVTRSCEGHGGNPGFGQHERDHSLAEYVTNGFLHLFYCLDRDAGTSIYNEGVPTENDMLYQRIPVDSIPTTPLIENYPLHWDSTGFYTAAENPRAPLPTETTLRAYPNPFNSTTNIEFTLTRSEKITLKIHDILGREVTTLANKTLPAGTHNLSWNADNISSGLYFVSLLTSTQTHTQKLLLLR